MNTKLTNQDIYDHIYAAISECRLLPGTKLSEEKLAQTFHASRTRIREVLLRLSQELIVETHPNRGAFVSSPKAEDIKQVFAVRRALERAIAAELSGLDSKSSVDTLRGHLRKEATARQDNDHSALARLTGEFHVLLAETTGNRLYAENLRRLVALTGLLIAQYSDGSNRACPEDEHSDIVHAIEQGDASRAEQLMLEHLNHVQSGIQPPVELPAEVDFRQIFGLAD
ncbi:GntR family transcriptional regulator [Paludibacterium yongneupense]|uniref:GntR family transcriptional regulator n=1 Tax=Paludibacterium yongneupense TaxID=400061 RepID=UPI000429ECD0|nr:GntR family transcriptional regulator [Paludibacterium yongneupense]